MPSNVFWGMQHLNENVLAAVSLEMTGESPILHEMIELCVLPLDRMLKPHPELIMFNMRFQPQDPSSINPDYCRLTQKQIAEAVMRGINAEKGAQLFTTWFDQLKLPEKKKIIPIAFNWPRSQEVLRSWLTEDIYRQIFADDYRDVLIATHFLNDRDACRGEKITYAKQTLPWLATKLHVERATTGGSCAEDAMTLAEVYRRLL